MEIFKKMQFENGNCAVKDFTKPIIAEVLEYPASPVYDRESYLFGTMLDSLGITYSEEVDDYYYVGDLHIFEFNATKEQFEIIKEFDAVYYQ